MATPFEHLLDKALDIPAARVDARVAKLRHDFPEETVADLVERAGKRFQTEAAISGGAVGASAAFPAIGTGTATVLTVGQTTVFLSSAVLYVLTVAELHGIRVTDVERRRALVLSALLGREGAEAVQGQLGLSTLFWARQMINTMPANTVKTVNKQLAKRAAKKTATKAGALTLGRLAPFGIGAAIGYSGGKALSKQIIDGTAAALGPVKLDAPVPEAEVIDL